MADARIAISNDELVTVRDGMRGLNRLVDQLHAGAREQVVLTRGSRMVAVVVSIERYAVLTAREPATGLGGAELRDVALEVLRGAGGGPLHYRQWYELVLQAGHPVGGRDPLATFLAQIARAPEVDRVGAQRSGMYRLRNGSGPS